jgi:hypothetical protein
MTRIELSGGVAVRTFHGPPEGFDPVTADDRELLVYGYPARPPHPEMLERWLRVLSRPVRMIQPAFAPRPGRRRQLPELLTPGQPGVETTSVWSGAVAHAPAADPFTWIEGTWTVPNAYPPPGAAAGDWYSASSWVGIDGIDGSMDVLQAGVDSDVMSTGWGPERQISPWWEWLPGDSYWITNLAVAQGDVLNCVICVSEGTSASIFFYNVTSRVGASFAATVPPGWQPLTGNCAEWIVERIPVEDSPPELARYGEVYFGDAQAGTASHALIQAGTGNTIDMIDATGTISTGVIETPTLIQVKYTGP